jgi:2-oxoglutarate dehydrogenase E2 component (dihydrolipoamide succinyltransferase)
MSQIEVLLPKMGESVAEATITTWLKKVGESIEAEESLVEIATDKVDSEVPAPAGGTVLKILVAEGEVAKVGQAIAIIGAEGQQSVETNSIETPILPFDNSPSPSPTASSPEIQSGDRFYSPLVKNIAKQEGITQGELDALEGTGQGGRLTKKDILAYLPNRNKAASTPASASTTAPSPSVAVPTVAVPKETVVAITADELQQRDFGGNVEIIEMDRMRRLIADHMVKSKTTSPHVTSFVEADVTNIVRWREKVKKSFEQKEGEKLTFTPIFIEAIAKAIKDFPMVNISVEGNYLIRKKFINIGMATALPSGNLIVPVIKNADQLNLVGLTRAVNDLAARARDNKLKPDEIQGGTYTISNVGSFGNVMGTPVINQPQVAIMAVGAIQKKPSVIETPEGDVIAIRHKMFLSHSYDHRVVDGSLGGMFVRRVADYLEQFDIHRAF